MRFICLKGLPLEIPGSSLMAWTKIDKVLTFTVRTSICWRPDQLKAIYVLSNAHDLFLLGSRRVRHSVSWINLSDLGQ
jgi:hypothetical protein